MKVPFEEVNGLDEEGWGPIRATYLEQLLERLLAIETVEILPAGKALADQELGDDVLVRLTKRRLFLIDNWQIVKSLFQARSVDPRITKHPWMAELLLDINPPKGYLPVAGGFLDAETVWPILLRHAIGLTAESPDLLSLLKWSIDPDNVRSFRNAPQEFRDATSEWLVQLVGPTVDTVLRCAVSTELPDTLPVGLAAGVVYTQHRHR